MDNEKAHNGYRVINVLKNGEIVENMDGYKVTVNEETKAFYILMASIAKDKTA